MYKYKDNTKLQCISAIAENAYEGTKSIDILIGRNKEQNKGIHIQRLEHSRSVQNMLSFTLTGFSLVPRFKTHSRKNGTYNARIEN